MLSTGSMMSCRLKISETIWSECWVHVHVLFNCCSMCTCPSEWLEVGLTDHMQYYTIMYFLHAYLLALSLRQTSNL